MKAKTLEAHFGSRHSREDRSTADIWMSMQTNKNKHKFREETFGFWKFMSTGSCPEREILEKQNRDQRLLQSPGPVTLFIPLRIWYLVLMSLTGSWSHKYCWQRNYHFCIMHVFHTLTPVIGLPREHSALFCIQLLMINCTSKPSLRNFFSRVLPMFLHIQLEVHVSYLSFSLLWLCCLLHKGIEEFFQPPPQKKKHRHIQHFSQQPRDNGRTASQLWTSSWDKSCFSFLQSGNLSIQSFHITLVPQWIMNTFIHWNLHLLMDLCVNDSYLDIFAVKWRMKLHIETNAFCWIWTFTQSPWNSRPAEHEPLFFLFSAQVFHFPSHIRKHKFERFSPLDKFWVCT